MEMRKCRVGSGRTKLSWKECRISVLQSFSPCFYKNRCPSMTKRTEKVLEQRLICPEFAALRLYSGLMHQSNSCCAKFSRRRCRRQGWSEAMSDQEAKVQHYNFNEYEWNAQKYYMNMIKVLFIVVPEFKLKGDTKRTAGLFKDTLSESLKSKMNLFNVDGLWGLQQRVMKLCVQWPLSRVSWSRTAGRWWGWGENVLRTTFSSDISLDFLQGSCLETTPGSISFSWCWSSPALAGILVHTSAKAGGLEPPTKM